MKEHDVRRDFAKYVSLNILAQAAYSLYTLADTFLVSARLGADGLAALNLAFPVFCLINGTGLMLGVGGGARCATAQSRGEAAAADRSFTGAALLTAVFSLLYGSAGLFFSAPVARALGADDALLSMTVAYLRTLLLFAPAFLTNHLLQCFVRNDGCPALSAAAMVCGSVSDIALAYVFIFYLDLGIFGSALAAGLAPVIGVAVTASHLLRGRNRFHLVRALPSFGELRAILSTGMSPFLTEAASGVVLFVFNAILLRLAGNVGVAAFSVVTVVSLVVVAIYTGLSQGVQPLLSRSHGTRDAEAVRAVLRRAAITVSALSAAIYAAVALGAERIVSAFNSGGDALLRAYAVSGMRLYFTACPFLGFNILLATFFLSTERPRPAQAISLLRGLIVPVPMARLLSALLGMTGVWCAYPATEAVVAALGAAYFLLRGRGKTA